MIKTGFKTAGLFPLNRAAVYWEKLAPGSLHAEKTPKGEAMVVTDKMAAVIELSDEMAGNMDLTDEVAGDIELMVQGEAREDVVEEDAPGSVHQSRMSAFGLGTVGEPGQQQTMLLLEPTSSLCSRTRNESCGDLSRVKP